MSLKTVFDAIENALRPVSIAVAQGSEKLGDNTEPPRIVLVPGEEMFSGPAPHFVSSQRVLHLRHAVVAAHIWGEDWDDVERVIQALLYVLRALVGKSFEIVGGRWKQQDGAALVQAGRTYVLEFRLLIPVMVPDGNEGAATVTQTDTTDTSLPFDGTVLGG